jgi:hypothetical protein
MVLIVEQEQEHEFNRGALNNIGFSLTAPKSDYTCFHDVDWLPIWADYSEPTGFTPNLWYGAKSIIDSRGVGITHDLDQFFGGVVLMQNLDIRRVNGYSNSYWGWGYEDTDLFRRVMIAGIALTRRKGTYINLTHSNGGFEDNGQPSRVHLRNKAIFKARFPVADGNLETSNMLSDGLNSLNYRVLRRRALPSPPSNERGVIFKIVTVSLAYPMVIEKPAPSLLPDAGAL